jgi:hypothetical protein
MAKRRVKAAEEWREYADGINEVLAKLDEVSKRHKGLLPARLLDRQFKIRCSLINLRACAMDEAADCENQKDRKGGISQ